MAQKRSLPRPFTMHWGGGQIVEAAAYTGQWHEPAIQLMEYTDGEIAGAVQMRFCSYSHSGQFQRSPLILGEEGITAMRQALEGSPRLRALLRRLVE